MMRGNGGEFGAFDKHAEECAGGEWLEGMASVLAAHRREYLNKPGYEMEVDFGDGGSSRWDLDEMQRDFHAGLIRAREAVRPERPEEKQGVRALFFRMGERMFVVASRSTLSLIAPTREQAVVAVERLQAKYVRRKDARRKAFFHLIASSDEYGGPTWRTVKVPVPDPGLGLPGDLDLHYGEGAEEWVEQWAESLKARASGLTLFRGEPGTGKTTFLRHMVWRLQEGHRFYLLPSGQDALLSRQDTVNFWVGEATNCALAKVAVLEDAEALLAPRDQMRGDAVSNLLNATDGLMGDFLRVHLVATVNCKLTALDAACRRPGRMLWMREFGRMERERAEMVADRHGLELRGDQRDYSLAEIFHGASKASAEAKVGFA